MKKLLIVALLCSTHLLSCKTTDTSEAKDIWGVDYTPRQPSARSRALPGVAWRIEYSNGGFAGPMGSLFRINADGVSSREPLAYVNPCDTRGDVISCSNDKYSFKIKGREARLKVSEPSSVLALTCASGNTPAGRRIICNEGPAGNAGGDPDPIEETPARPTRLPGNAWVAEYSNGGFAGPMGKLYRSNADGEVPQQAFAFLNECNTAAATTTCVNDKYSVEFKGTKAKLNLLETNKTVAMTCTSAAAPAGRRTICRED